MSIPQFAFVGDTTSLDARSVARMAREAHTAIRRMYEFFQPYNEVFMRFVDDGTTGTFIVKNPVKGTVTPSAWFSVTDLGDGLVKVSEGRIACPDIAGADGAVPSLTSFLRELTVPEKELTVTDGSKIYCKINAALLPAPHDYSGTDDDEILEITVKMRASIWHATSGEIVVQTTPPVGNSTTGYVLLADITVTDGSVTIKQRHSGTIFTAAITAPYGAAPTITAGFSSASYSVCVSGVAGTVDFLVIP